MYIDSHSNLLQSKGWGIEGGSEGEGNMNKHGSFSDKILGLTESRVQEIENGAKS